MIRSSVSSGPARGPTCSSSGRKNPGRSPEPLRPRNQRDRGKHPRLAAILPIGSIHTTYVLMESDTGTIFEDRSVLVLRFRFLNPLAKPLARVLARLFRIERQYETLKTIVASASGSTRFSGHAQEALPT